MGIKDIQKEIDELDKAVGMGPLTKAPGTNAPATTAPATEVPDEELTTEAPNTTAPLTESPSTDTPSTKAPTTEVPDEEKERLRARIAELEAKEKGPKTEAPKTSAPSTNAPISDEDFLADADLDEITRDPKAFNTLLNNIYKKAVETVRGEVRKGNESIMRSIPDITKNTIAVQTALKKASDEFYAENKDLEPFKKVVGVVFEEIASANPDKSYSEVLKEVGVETRKRLELTQKTVTDTKNKKGDPPPLPRKKGERVKDINKPDLTPMQKELEAMNKVIN